MGAVTPAGRALKSEVDGLSSTPMALAKVAVASGEIPSQTMIGLDLDDVG